MISKNEMGSQRVPMINFNPAEIGKAEYGWWRAHNDKDYPKLAEFLTLQFAKQYGLSAEEAKTASKSFLQVLKYHDEHNWDGAVEVLTDVYEIVQKHAYHLIPRIGAEKEVNLWGLHDELEEQEDKTPLTEAFIDLYSEIYGVDRKLLKDAAEQRTLATVEHDRAEQEGISPEEAEEHWEKVKEHLITFYTQLKDIVGANI